MSEKKTKPKYSSVENVGWMIANAWRECRSVLLICVIIAVVSVALNLTELFIAPQILQRVENGAEVSSLLLTIAVSSGALFLLMGLKRYFEDNISKETGIWSAGVSGIWWNFASHRIMTRSMRSGGRRIFRSFRSHSAIRFRRRQKSSSRS